MTDSTRASGTGSRKLNTEGADMLTLAGVNDANLIELSRVSGAKVALRGDTLTLTGPDDVLDRAQQIAQRMIEQARQGLVISADEIGRAHV